MKNPIVKLFTGAALLIPAGIVALILGGLFAIWVITS